MVYYELFSLKTINQTNFINTVNLLDIAIIAIVFILMRMTKNSLELYNWLMFIFIVKACLVPYFNFDFEKNNDLSIIITHSS